MSGGDLRDYWQSGRSHELPMPCSSSQTCWGPLDAFCQSDWDMHFRSNPASDPVLGTFLQINGSGAFDSAITFGAAGTAVGGVVGSFQFTTPSYDRF